LPEGNKGKESGPRLVDLVSIGDLNARRVALSARELVQAWNSIMNRG